MRDADADLAELEAAPRLNHGLYTAEPHEYFSHRLFFLMLAADQTIDLAQFVRGGLEVDKVKLGPNPEATEDKESKQQRYRFVLAESLTLLHHVAETLLRLYFAHAGTPPAPWTGTRKGSLTREVQGEGAPAVHGQQSPYGRRPGGDRHRLPRLE